jgi:hypothetical protein
MTTSATFTNRRLWRHAYALMAFQAAAHTPESDFSSGKNLWFREFVVDPQVEKPYAMGGETSPYRVKDGKFISSAKPVAHGIGMATPKMLETILRSWGGSWSSIGGGQYQLGLTRNLNEYATLALVENKDTPNPEILTRLWDAWAHRVTLRMRPGLEAVDLEAFFAARDYDRTPLNALGGISLPSSYAPMDAGEVLAPHSFRLLRDPAGSDVSIAAQEFSITFDAGLLHEAFCESRPLVKKVGYTTVAISLRGTVEDETYGITTDADSLTFKRFVAQWASDSGKAFSVDLKNVDFSVNPIGWKGRLFEFQVHGEAFMDSSTGAFVTITNTP